MPARGEIWLVNFNPTVGDEIQKSRPAVIISSDAIHSSLALKLVVPVTEWQAAFATKPWHTKLAPSKTNGLSKESSADAQNLRAVSVNRLTKRLGQLQPEQTEAVAAAIALLVEYQ